MSYKYDISEELNIGSSLRGTIIEISSYEPYYLIELIHKFGKGSTIRCWVYEKELQKYNPEGKDA